MFVALCGCGHAFVHICCGSFFFLFFSFLKGGGGGGQWRAEGTKKAE